MAIEQSRRRSGRSWLAETVDRVTGRERAALIEEYTAERDMRITLEETMQRLGQQVALMESIGDLEGTLFEPGWQRFLILGDIQFTREGMQQLVDICRLMAIKNPLIKRGLALRSAYVWGEGATIHAGGRNSAAAVQDVNGVVQQFLDRNKKTLSGPVARQRNEHSLGTDGSLYLSLFTNPRTGEVQVRVLSYDEVHEIHYDPEDRARVRYYKRLWTEVRFDTRTGRTEQTQRIGYYPDVAYRPAPPVRPGMINGSRVYWDAPVVQIKVNAPEGWDFGIPDAYAAVDWAAAYKVFLEDWATLVKALSRFAWKATTPTSRQAGIRGKLTTAPTLDPVTREPMDIGATALMDPATTFEAVSKSGAVTVDSESGRPLAMMVAAALGIPVTMLLGDPGLTGARAVAETLDQPTELEMGSRRNVWSEALVEILDYVIDWSVRAPQGPLKGTVQREGDREVVTLSGDADRGITIDWPDLDEIDPKTAVEAINIADQIGYLPPLVIVRMLLNALGVDDPDAVLEELTDEQGNFMPPADKVAQAAADAFRAGKDSAMGSPDTAADGEEPTPPPAEDEGP